LAKTIQSIFAVVQTDHAFNIHLLVYGITGGKIIAHSIRKYANADNNISLASNHIM